MIMAVDTHTSTLPQTESPLAHWRQVRRLTTVEEAEHMVEDLQSQGIDAVLSMIDGLCVLARRD